MPLMPPALTAAMLRARQSTSSYTVPHYNHTGTHTTYMHWSTSGSVLGIQSVSSGTPPLSRGPYYIFLGEGEAGVGPGRGVSCGAVRRPLPCRGGTLVAAQGLPYYYYYFDPRIIYP